MAIGRAMEQAAVTLARGTAFLRVQARQSWLDQPWCDRHRLVRSRVVGNWIGELDRLLHVLMDAAALQAGHAPTAWQRNTAAKLAALCADAAWSAPQLAGMARARATFRYTQGSARRADVRGGAYMTVGWSEPDGTLRRFRIGERVQLSSAALIEICDLYDELAARIMDTAGTFKERAHQGI